MLSCITLLFFYNPKAVLISFFFSYKDAKLINCSAKKSEYAYNNSLRAKALSIYLIDLLTLVSLYISLNKSELLSKPLK